MDASAQVHYPADFCPDDDSADTPHPLALACSRPVVPADPPWPTRQNFAQERGQEGYSAAGFDR